MDYTDISEIPAQERKGHYTTVQVATWDYSDVEIEHIYHPTTEEIEAVAANKKAAEEHARAFFLNVPEVVKPAIATVISHMMNSTHYPQDRFSTISVDGVTSPQHSGFESNQVAVEKPDGPGRVMIANTRALSGTDQPNKIEMMRRQSMMDGLDIMFPPEALAKYFQDFLSRPLLARDTNLAQTLKSGNRDFFDKIEKLIDSMITPANADNEGFAIRNSPADTRQMLDKQKTDAPDNLHARNVAAIGEFIRHKPEYVVSLFMWAQAVTDYCRDLKNYVNNDLPPDQQALAKEAPVWDVVGLIQGNSAAKGKSNIDNDNKIIPGNNSSFLLVAPLISSVMGALLEQSGITHNDATKRDIDPSMNKEALEKLSISGMFHRKITDDNNKPVFIRCPMSRKLGEWLTLDLAGKGDPKDEAFSQFVVKVREELASPEDNITKRLCERVSEKIDLQTDNSLNKEMKKDLHLHPSPA